MEAGKIILKRHDENFEAGFCIIKEDLHDLVKKKPILHTKEAKYYDTLKFNKKKESYLLGRLAGKLAIDVLNPHANLSSILIESGVFQFPIVKSPLINNIQISITHCNNFGVALAFPEAHPLGVDIEKIDNEKVEDMKSQMGSLEIDLIYRAKLPISHGCALLWTTKESLSKIIRTGLTIDFKMLEIETLEKFGNYFISTFSHFVQYKTISCFSGDYVCSVVLPKNTIPELDNFWSAFINASTREIIKS